MVKGVRRPWKLTAAAVLMVLGLAVASADALAYQHVATCRANIEGKIGDNDLARWIRERTPTGVVLLEWTGGYYRFNHRLQPQMALYYQAYRQGRKRWSGPHVPGYCVGHDGRIVDHAGRVPDSWLGVIPDPVRKLQANVRNERPTGRVPVARASESDGQRDAAAARVEREARKVQRRMRYSEKRGDGRTWRVTPRATWTLYGTVDTGPVVTLRWRVRVQSRGAGWLVCRGTVTVHGEAAPFRAVLKQTTRCPR